MPRRLRGLGGRSLGSAVFDFLNVFLIILLTLTFLYPLWFVILSSFATEQETMSLGFHLWISEFQFEAYRFAFSEYGNVQRAFVNSTLRTVLGTFFILIVTMFGAYPLSKRNLPGRNAFTIFFLVTMFFGGGLIPTYLWMRKLGMMNSRLALILPMLSNTFYIIIVRNFLMTIDSAYEEAALIDGANYVQKLARVIAPLSMPVLATIALWAAVAHWNAWFDALIYIKSESKQVLQIFLRRLLQEVITMYQDMGRYMLFTGEELPSKAVQAAVTIITIGPIILVYPFIQRYFIKGIFTGSLKG